jgi:iron complex outermembrane recepter protein
VADTALTGARRSLALPISFSILLSSSAAVLYSGSSFAQAAGSASAPAAPVATGAAAPANGQIMGQLTEVVVTALKRSTNIQQTPLAISAVSGQTLTNMGITDSQQLAQISPDLQFHPDANGGSQIVIRNIQSAGEPTVGLYYDETPVVGSVGVTNNAGETTPDIRLFDMERVEVLRGPQGTLYGSSSMAGTVRLIFNKPNLANYEGDFDAQVTTVQDGKVGNEEQGMINLPLVNDVLGVRVVAFRDYSGGWLNNPQLNLNDFNDNDANGGRVTVRFRPMKGMTLDLLAVTQNTTGFNDSWNYALYTKGGPAYEQTLATQEPNSDQLRLYSATLNWDMGPATLTAVTSYTDRDLAFSFDYSPYFRTAAAAATAASAGCKTYEDTDGANCTPAQLSAYQAFAESWGTITAFQPQETRNITQELRLSSEGDTRLSWTLGGYASQRNTNVLSQLNTANPLDGVMYTPTSPVPFVEGSATYPATTGYQRTVRDVLDQIAGYAQVTYAITQKLDVTAGTRHFDYDTAVTGAVQVGNPVLQVSVSPSDTARASYSGEVSKFGIDYKWTDDLMSYVSASQGFRPGGVNEVIGLPTALGPYAPDRLWDYEIGTNSSWLDHRLVINGDVFQIDWSNMQVSAETTSQANGSTFGFVTNAGHVVVRGVELEVHAQPMNGLLLSASGSFAPARLNGNEAAPAGIAILGAGTNGDYVPYSPSVTLQASAQYTAPINSALDWMARLDGNYTGDSWTVFNRTNEYEEDLPGYAIANLRTGVESSDGKWETYFFISNLMNKIGYINKSYGSSVGPSPAETILTTPPRTFGLDATYHF